MSGEAPRDGDDGVGPAVARSAAAVAAPGSASGLASAVAPGVVSAPDLVQPDPWTALRAHTPARIALGRSGVSMPTAELLRFGAAHAQARDAVHVPLDVAALVAALHADGVATLRANSAAPDRATYLLRPDLGRRLADASRDGLRQAQQDGGRGPVVDPQAPASTDRSAPGAEPACDLLLVLADGLSSLAAASHGPALVAAIRATAPAGWTLGPVVVATQARVALGDDIGAALNARMVAVLIGERPGLSAPDSLGIYLTWAPRVGRTDAQRNCLSNVRPAGLSVDEAARKLWWLCTAARRLRLTGIGLKDESDAVA